MRGPWGCQLGVEVARKGVVRMGAVSASLDGCCQRCSLAYPLVAQNLRLQDHEALMQAVKP